MNHINLSAISFLVILGCSPSMALEQSAKKPSTFFEDTELAIAIKPLTSEQNAKEKEKERLAGSIQNLNIRPITPAFELVKGKRVDDQFRVFGKQSGWNLIWQAPEYVLDQNMTIPGDFESSILFFLSGANEAGTRLRAVFYRGNKTVRVTEF